MALQKVILTPDDLKSFQASETHQHIVTFVQALNDSVIGVKLPHDDKSVSQGVQAVLNVLNRVKQLAEETPPVDNKASRFGNPAFKTFYDKVLEESRSLHLESFSSLGLPETEIDEISTYFAESWGNRTRIDYGSGMELNFVCWLLCLKGFDVLKEADHTAIVVKIFWKYIEVMRVLQSTYWLEPAGSHGVWGLDDYHFLPFLFGSAQLRKHPHIKPRSVRDNALVEMYAKDWMYFACIEFTNSVKTNDLRTHSPMLDDISMVKTWDKVNEGMIKMYQAEVLGKLPVVQHFLFGSILKKWEGAGEASPHEDEHGHIHNHGKKDMVWGDCCGIPVPSAFAAAAEVKMGERLSGPGIKPIPFD